VVNFDEISRAVIKGDNDTVFQLAEKALGNGIPSGEILNRGLVPGIQKVGDLFARGEYFLPELIVSGEAVSQALELLEPGLRKENASHMGKFVIGTVQGDVHDLGKNIVVMMLKGNGWEVTDLGVDVSPEDFCAAVKEGDFHILGMSSLLTMTMPNAARTIEVLQAAGLRDKVRVMVGGAPTTGAWAAEIGADAHAKDGPTTAKTAAALIGKS